MENRPEAFIIGSLVPRDAVLSVCLSQHHAGRARALLLSPPLASCEWLYSPASGWIGNSVLSKGGFLNLILIWIFIEISFQWKTGRRPL